MKNCIECGKELEDGSLFCTSCGAKQPVEKHFCKYCGNEIDVDAVVCPKCGKQLKELKTSVQTGQVNVVNTVISNVPTGKRCEKWPAWLLCFFLGFFGAHKFYEGKVGIGILYLLTCGIFGIGWFIDTIAYLFHDDPYYV